MPLDNDDPGLALPPQPRVPSYEGGAASATSHWLSRLRLPRSPFRGRYRKQWLALALSHPVALLEFWPWARSRQPGRSAIDDGVPWIPFKALKWLSQQLTTEARVFEWGSGGSTIFLAQRTHDVVSIEHDPTWYQVVVDRLAREGLSGCNYRLVEPRPAPPGGTQFGSGQRGSTHLDFETYVRSIEPYPDASFDLVLIDGRARLACLRAAWAKVRIGGHIYLDNSNYERYQGFLNGPANFARHDVPGVSPYGGDVWTQGTIWRRSR